MNNTKHRQMTQNIMRTIKTKKVYAGNYEVYDKQTKELLGYVKYNEETGMWYAYDLDHQPHDTDETKKFALTAFEIN